MIRRIFFAIFLILGCDPRPSASTDAGVPDGAMRLPDGAIVPSCDGIALEDDGVLDFDLAGGSDLARVSGVLTVDGADLPIGVSLGALVFVGEAGSSRAELRTGATSFETQLPRGSYEVRYEPPFGAVCGAAEPLPCIAARFAEVAVTSDGALDLDITTAAVSGRVTVDGVAIEDSTAGSLEIASDTGVAYLPITGAGWSARVVASTYRVGWLTSGYHCTGAAVPSAPCNSGVVREKVGLISDGALDIDLATGTVRGRVTADGARVTRGSIVFESENAGPYAVAVGASESYTVRLLRGSYEVEWRSDGSCDGRSAPVEPCNSGIVRSGVNIAGEGALDIDLPARRVSGRLSVEGAPLPTSSAYSGAIEFRDRDSTTTVFALGAAYSTYEVTLLAGTYDVSFEPNEGLCDGTRAADGPCNGVEIEDGVSIEADGVVDVDLPVVEITGTIRANGGAITGSRFGAIVFERDGDELALAFPADDTYTVSLAPGTYEIGFAGDDTRCADASSLPCIGGAITTAAAVNDGVLDLDLTTSRVSGTVTVDGETPSAGDRARLRFVASNGASGAIVLSSSGPAAYAATLLAGMYDVEWEPASICESGGGPCVEGTIRRAVDVSGPSGALDLDVPVVHLEGRVTVMGAPIASVADVGFVSFEMLDGGSFAAPIELGTYETWLFPGRYVIGFAPGAGCDPELLPCSSLVLEGCPD